MTEEDVGIVYLVQPAELVGTDRYKVGGSNKPTLDRLKAYRKGTRILFVGECVQPFDTEREIKAAFNEKFNLFSGTEFFNGDENAMFDEMIKVFKKCRDKLINKKVIKLEKKQERVVKLPKHICGKCNTSFVRKRNLDNHILKKACKQKDYKCKYCNKGFTSDSSMYRHIRTICNKKNEKDNRLKELEKLVTDLTSENNVITIISKKKNPQRNGKYQKAIRNRS